MKKQIIVAMGREHGSGGHYIADMVTSLDKGTQPFVVCDG